MTVRFMLDTDIVSYALRGQGRVAESVARHPSSEICISAITMAQLCYGADRRRSSKVRESINEFVREIAILPFDGSCARYYGAIASELEQRGARVTGLRVENWF
jgi:tRNA(fMet)-specific endonuclease VapC